MVDRVAHEVHQRIAQLVDHPLVQLGLFAANQQVDFLATFLRQVANDTFEAIEQRADGNHPRVQHAALETVRDAGELIDGFADLAEAVTTVLPDVGLFVHQFHARPQLLNQRGPVAGVFRCRVPGSRSCVASCRGNRGCD